VRDYPFIEILLYSYEESDWLLV